MSRPVHHPPRPPAVALVRPMQPDDVRAVGAVRVAGWRAAYVGMVPDDVLDAMTVEREHAEASPRRLARLAERRTGAVDLVAVGSGTPGPAPVLGFAMGGPERVEGAPAHVGEVYALYVDPPSWRLGVGSLLITATLVRLAAHGFGPVGLWVLAANTRARAFYARHGFAPTGESADLDFDGRPVREVRLLRPPDGAR